jgi:hypothetical protein
LFDGREALPLFSPYRFCHRLTQAKRFACFSRIGFRDSLVAVNTGGICPEMVTDATPREVFAYILFIRFFG